MFIILFIFVLVEYELWGGGDFIISRTVSLGGHIINSAPYGCTAQSRPVFSSVPWGGRVK